MKKKMLAGLLTVVMMFSLVACSAPKKEQDVQETDVTAESDNTKIVGISTLPATSLSSSLVLQGIIDGATAQGWTTKEASCEDVESQVAGIETLVESGIKVIAVGAIDNDSLTNILTTAKDNGIKVFDTYALPEELTDIACSFSQKEFGYSLGLGAGTYAKETWNDEEIQVLVFTSSTSPLWIERSDGVVEGLEASGANINVVATEEAWETEEALSRTESVLQAHPDLRMVLAINDAASLGAYTAFINAGKTDGDKYFVGGIDIVPQVLKYMQEEGTIYKGGVYLDLYAQAKKGTEMAIEKALGAEDTEREVIPVDHKYIQFDDAESVNEIAELYSSLGY